MHITEFQWSCIIYEWLHQNSASPSLLASHLLILTYLSCDYNQISPALSISAVVQQSRNQPNLLYILFLDKATVGTVCFSQIIKWSGKCTYHPVSLHSFLHNPLSQSLPYLVTIISIMTQNYIGVKGKVYVLSCVPCHENILSCA